ncbi:DUF4347 domain-containing protein [Mesorhizobium huakuii]|uniref:DUF4347 domain-containing protein n=1 Tax=Mesorhizobium huakuii TaxID=28104 RepID=A0ABZ0VMD7_9HYPH|nr:DUF4347 domain-containing protein [Mesorhizobium huakuii]WQB97484.1 DUF4347 domain-containing protein [Mesorhizobium huakuii]
MNQVLSRAPQGVVPRFDGRQIHPLPAAATGRPHARTDATQAGASEILFVDPSVSDLATILRNLRPEVEAILLDATRPAARQMARALEGRYGLDAVHVIAHGAPGRVSFAADEWSLVTLDADGPDLATIGRVLGGSGELLLWSCNAGAAGTNFIDALSCAAGTPVAAASDLVGSPALGGDWKLNVRTTEDAAARPPLTEVGMGIYAGILVAEVMVTGTVPVGAMGGPVTYYIVDTDQKSIVGQVMLPSAMPQATPVSMAVKVPNGTAPLAIGTFDATGNFQPSDILRVNAPAKPTGAVGPSGR